jgi:hypothetical protein
MRIKIDHSEEKRGLLFKTTYSAVTFSVVFNETELQIIKSEKLGKELFAERLPPADISNGGIGKWDLYVKDLVKGKPDTYLCPGIVEANIYETALMEHFQELKAYFDAALNGGESSKEIEL